MPVEVLLVEGHLDAEVLGAILAGVPAVLPGNPKGSLGPRARDKRQDGKVHACYLCDRDFDFDPPTTPGPVPDHYHPDKTVLGWRWCRHEIENYLIDPKIVTRALGWEEAVYGARLSEAARAIRPYQAARETIARVRRALPPARNLNTRPEDCHGHDFRLPSDLSEGAVFSWARAAVANFKAQACAQMAPEVVEKELTDRASMLSEIALSNPETILLRFSGKDLLTALIPWLQDAHKVHPTQLLIRLRNWVEMNPEDAVALLPEWRRLREILRA